MEYGEVLAVRTWVVGKVTLIIDKDQSLYNQVQAIKEEEGQHANADQLGQAICDWLRESIDSSVTPLVWSQLLLDVLDLNDSKQAALIGEHYLED